MQNNDEKPSQPSEPPLDADPQAVWPQAPAIMNQVYAFSDPTHGQDMVAMLRISFLQHGTMIEELRRICTKQDARIRELLADIAVRDHKLADVEARLTNLRDIRRREKRADLEPGIVLPGDPRFNQAKGTQK